MTPLITNSNTYASRSARPSAPPPDLRMPHVFVIPPEEEQRDNPPWCCFDAGEPLEDSSDFPSNPDNRPLHSPYPLQQTEEEGFSPIARTSVYQPRSRASISKKLEKKQRPEAVKIIENRPLERNRGEREDSDVVEVMKVKRTREALTDPEENTKVKRSKTLKARATRALRSIKNAGKSSHRTHVKDLWTSSEGMPGIFKGIQEQIRSKQDQTENRSPTTPTKKGSLSRRSLSQIFQPNKPLRPEYSFTVRGASSAPLAEAHHFSNPSSLSHLGYSNTNPSLDEVPSSLTIDGALNRPVSSRPSMRKNAKFSVRELHRLFTFSSLPNGPSSGPTTTPTALCGSIPSGSTTTLASSFDHLEIPVEEDVLAGAHVLDLDSPDRKLASPHLQGFRTSFNNGSPSPHRLSDLSFEMKLDSLHFDALSFDAEDFDVSMEGNVQR